VAQDHGHEVRLVDAVAEDMETERLINDLLAFDPDLLFCETSTPSLANDLAFLRAAREQCPDTEIAAGGTHAAELAVALMREEGLPDYWLAGEYDFSVAQLADALEDRRSLETVSGLITAGGIHNPAAAVEDVAALPSPLFDRLPMAHYADPVCGLPAPSAQSWTSRGCPYGCTFCVWPQIVYGNRRYRKRPIHAAVEEVGMLMERYGCESFYFDDDTTNIGEDRMAELARAVRASGLDAYPWAMMARADCMTPDMIETLADAGLYSIKYGVESISCKLINACNKGTSLERFHEAIRRTADAGIKMHLTFTFGIPGETVDTIRETMDFALATAPETAQFSICTPFPGTRFYAQCKAEGWLETDDWSAFIGSDRAVIGTPWLGARELENAYRSACEQWQVSVEKRLNKRRGELTKKLQKLVAQGATWTLLGDEDFAGFLVEHADLKAALKPGDPEAVPVMVSHHDEEKIWRRMKREHPDRATRALRLYG
jgi:radical SAM superfamily enzyme YgiQ (UPF0313 family)